jgi:uncharacterized phage-associated protein
MIEFKFDEAKTTQAAAFLLKKNGGKMNYMKLIKLLYLADRRAISLWERPLTGDTYVSMDNGPVLSKVLDKINYGKVPSKKSYWHKYISRPISYNVSITREPEYDELSAREIKLLEYIFRKYKSFDQWKMVDICHDILPEWKNPDGTSIPIHIDDILKALNKTEMDIIAIDEELSNLNHVKAVLASEAC